jgi:hypothetical protein
LSSISPLEFLKAAIKAVPPVKYALGVGGIVAVVAIVVGGWKIDPVVAVLGTIAMLLLMTILVIFAKLSARPASTFALPALVLTWFSLLMMMATAAGLFGSVFFGTPVNLQWWIQRGTSRANLRSPTLYLECRDEGLPIRYTSFDRVAIVDPAGAPQQTLVFSPHHDPIFLAALGPMAIVKSCSISIRSESPVFDVEIPLRIKLRNALRGQHPNEPHPGQYVTETGGVQLYTGDQVSVVDRPLKISVLDAKDPYVFYFCNGSEQFAFLLPPNDVTLELPDGAGRTEVPLKAVSGDVFLTPKIR